MNSNDRVAIARQILAQNDRLLALLEGSAPAKVTRPVTPKAKPAPKARKAPAKKAPAKTRHLTRKNRAEFVKAHAWAKGLSTQVIASMCTEDPSLLAKGWGIGERYAEMFSA